MISWDACRPFSKDDCSFQSKTLCKKRLPKQPQFKWQGTVAAGTWFQCRKPNYVLVMKVWFWFTNEKGECAVLFTAPKMVKDWVAFYHHGCRDAGTPCMNMFWRHALPITVFQPSLNLRFSVIQTMSVNLSIALCCVHCLQVLRFERGNANSKQSNTIIAAQLSQSLHKHTVPTENNIYQRHLFDWKLLFTYFTFV